MSCWDCLGIAVTQDSAAIKRAYAAKLKVTRPDDDPHAYQQLRDAFDAALAYARTTLVKAAAPDAPPAAEAACPAPVDLAENMILTWERYGDELLLSAWPVLKGTLDATPLPLATAYSTAFAFAVLDYEKLPPQFVELLKSYFGWGLDFKRKPGLTPAESISFSARLGRAEFELKAMAVRIEHERNSKIAAERNARVALEHSRHLAQQQHGKLMRLVEIVRRQSLAGARLAAYLGGTPFRSEWIGLTRDERHVLEIDDATFLEVSSVFATAGVWRRWSAFGCMLLASLFYVINRTGHLVVPLMLMVLFASYYFPLHVWHEKLRLFLYPEKLVRWWIVDTGQTYSRLFSIIYSTIPLILVLTLSQSVIGPPDQMSDRVAYVIAFMLACQWLIQAEPSDGMDKLFIPVFAFCLASCWAIGINDVWILLSVAAFWHATSYAATVGLWPWIYGSVWTFAMLLAISFWNGLPVVTLSFVVPYLLFKLARIESPEFVLAVMALATIFMPFSGDGLLALCVAAVVMLAGLVSIGLRGAGARLLARWCPDPFGLSLR